MTRPVPCCPLWGTERHLAVFPWGRWPSLTGPKLQLPPRVDTGLEECHILARRPFPGATHTVSGAPPLSLARDCHTAQADRQSLRWMAHPTLLPRAPTGLPGAPGSPPQAEGWVVPQPS